MDLSSKTQIMRFVNDLSDLSWLMGLPVGR